jgi:hypothetical protein
VLKGTLIPLRISSLAGCQLCSDRLNSRTANPQQYVNFAQSSSTFHAKAERARQLLAASDFSNGYYSLIAQLLMNEGFHYCSSFEGSLLLISEMPFVTFWGIVFLHETVAWHFWAGGAMIFASIIGFNRNLVFAEN